MSATESLQQMQSYLQHLLSKFELFSHKSIDFDAYNKLFYKYQSQFKIPESLLNSYVFFFICLLFVLSFVIQTFNFMFLFCVFALGGLSQKIAAKNKKIKQTKTHIDTIANTQKIKIKIKIK